MTVLRRLVVHLLALLVMNASATAAVVLPGSAPPAETEAPAAPARIEAKSDAGEDAQIARRIEGIFAALPALQSIAVKVRQGVVELSGTVSDPKDIDRAEQIASRVAGVVTVVNHIERGTSVDETFRSVSGISDRISSFIAMLPLIGAALLVGAFIAAFGYLLASFNGVWRRLAPNSFLAELIRSAIRFVFVIGGIVVALDILGATALLGAVLGGAGIIGLALGFAMRETVENYVASLMLSLRHPFLAEDHVVIGDMEGIVIRLTSRATILMTLDGNHLRIPNSLVFKAVILNYTRNPKRRFDFDLGIDAEDDPNAARHLGEEVLRSLDFILDDPPPTAWVEQVGDSNIVIKFLAWIDQRDTDWYKARSRAIPAVKSALEEAGFALPEPIYRLRFDAGSPLPFENLAQGPRPAQAAPVTAPASMEEPAPTQDLEPKHEISQMIEREREDAKEAGRDLLDPDRPVE